MSGIAIGIEHAGGELPAEAIGADIYIVPWRALAVAARPWRVDGRPVRAVAPHATHAAYALVSPRDPRLLEEYAGVAWEADELQDPA